VTSVDKAITEPSPMARAEEEGEGDGRRREHNPLGDDDDGPRDRGDRGDRGDRA
jgi:hypothetical protein